MPPYRIDAGNGCGLDLPVSKSVYESEPGEIGRLGDKLLRCSRKSVDHFRFMAFALGVEDQGRENDEQMLLRAIPILQRPYLGPSSQRMSKFHNRSPSVTAR